MRNRLGHGEREREREGDRERVGERERENERAEDQESERIGGRTKRLYVVLSCV